MSDSKKWHHRDHHANPPETPRTGWKQAHRDWRLWLVVGLMLVAMLTYVMTLDESVTPEGKLQPTVPAAPDFELLVSVLESGERKRQGGQPVIEVLSQSTEKVLAIRLSGKLLHRDYQQFVPMLEKRIEEHANVRCFIEMIDFQGIELHAFWDEIKFDAQHARQIERCAIVGDRAWESWLTKLSGPIFSNAEIQFYDLADRE